MVYNWEEFHPSLVSLWKPLLQLQWTIEIHKTITKYTLYWEYVFCC